MHKWEIDVAVLCIFFARPEQLKRTFEQVKKARPRVLLLWQDGPREGREDDIENIKKCREIVEDIDWECEVYRNYHESNMGCDPSTFLSHKWAFSIVDKCIVLEDDLVASQSFFTFCKKMLDKYENDTRIDRICCTNLLGEYNIPYDYFFAKNGNSTGWASWRRVAEKWEEDYRFLDNEYAMSMMELLSDDKKVHRNWLKRCIEKRNTGVPYWEYVIGAQVILNSGLCIYPRVNLISNTGLDVNSTHAPADLINVPKSTKQYFHAKLYEMPENLKEPDYIIEDKLFHKLCYKRLKGNLLNRIANIFERIIIKLGIKKLFYKFFAK